MPARPPAPRKRRPPENTTHPLTPRPSPPTATPAHEHTQEAQTGEYASLLPGLAAMARSMVRELDPRDDLEFFRVRGTRHEIMVAPSERRS